MTTLKFTGDLDRILRALPDILCDREYAISFIIAAGTKINVSVTIHLN